MLAEISAGLSSLKAATDIVKGLNAAKTDAAINSVKIELQTLILDAHHGLFAAQDAQAASGRRITELEQEIVRLKDWSAEKERYQLINMRQGSVAYAQKPTVENRQVPHWLCANCFEHGRKSFMQKQGEIGPSAIYKCGSCSSTMNVDRSERPA